MSSNLVIILVSVCVVISSIAVMFLPTPAAYRIAALLMLWLTVSLGVLIYSVFGSQVSAAVGYISG